ncbi:MAG: hypothetical protein FWD82_09930 [Defluviitaleaceae bacterium]|nr:hypothetical protein [Defluviitaleaceae bacterium]
MRKAIFCKDQERISSLMAAIKLGECEEIYRAFELAVKKYTDIKIST